MLDLACWCLTLLPVVWSIRALRARAREDERRGELAARSLVRLQSFRTFYLLVIAFIYFTRIVVYLLALTLPFEQTWLATFFAEAAALAFYGMTGWLFRPKGDNPYLPLEPEEGGGAFENTDDVWKQQDAEAEALEMALNEQEASAGQLSVHAHASGSHDQSHKLPKQPKKEKKSKKNRPGLP